MAQRVRRDGLSPSRGPATRAAKMGWVLTSRTLLPTVVRNREEIQRAK
jgi:hypothetical protein